jgi:hypothetical protein
LDLENENNENIETLQEYVQPTDTDVRRWHESGYAICAACFFPKFIKIIEIVNGKTKSEEEYQNGHTKTSCPHNLPVTTKNQNRLKYLKKTSK